MKSKLQEVKFNYESNNYSLASDDIDWLIKYIENNLPIEESKWESYANKMKASRDFWQDAYQKSQAIILSDEVKIEKLENKLRKFKNVDLDYLISIEKDYGQLIHENADLIQFKSIVLKYLTEQQLLLIQDEIENDKDTN